MNIHFKFLAPAVLIFERTFYYYCVVTVHDVSKVYGNDYLQNGVVKLLDVSRLEFRVFVGTASCPTVWNFSRRMWRSSTPSPSSTSSNSNLQHSFSISHPALPASPSTMSYVVSAHKPTSVRHALTCSFLSPNSTTLILASPLPPPLPFNPTNRSDRTSNILQIYEYDSSTGQCLPHAQHPLHAKIIALAVHKPPHYTGQDHLLILTDNYAAFTCSWDPQTQSLRNEKCIDGLHDTSLRPAEAGELVRLDPLNRCFALNLYQGLLTFLLIQHTPPSSSKRKSFGAGVEGTIGEAVSLRMRVLNLVEFTFLRADGGYPYLAVVWKDDELTKWLSVWEVDKLHRAADRDFVERLWANGQASVPVDLGARLLIPTNNGTNPLNLVFLFFFSCI